MKLLVCAWMCAGFAVVLCGPAAAQERIYRCGNEYTNSLQQAKQGNCKLVEGGHVTVVHGAAAPASAPATPSTRSTASAVGATPAVRPAVSPNAKVPADQQRARDSDARAILQVELAKAQERLKAVKAEFNGGQPIKTALELRNPQVYNERLQALQTNLKRLEGDVAGIERELARRPGG